MGSVNKFTASVTIEGVTYPRCAVEIRWDREGTDYPAVTFTPLPDVKD